MNPIPVMVWTAQHDSTLLPKSLDDAERIADELLGQETESHNPIYDVYQTFAAEMLAWMDQQKIPQLGAQASLHSDLRSGGTLNATQFYFENFPRDHKPLYSQFLNLAQAHQLVVYDTAGPLVFLPDGSSMPAAARWQLAALTNIYQLEEQNRNIHDIPTRFDQVPEWLKAQVDAHFAEYGFSECVIQVDDDGAIMGKAWKKTPAGLMLLSVLVYERYGSLRIWGYVKFFLRDLFKVKKFLKNIDYSEYKITYMSGFYDFDLSVRELKNSPEMLGVFFEKAKHVFEGYIRCFNDTKTFYDYAYKNAFKDIDRTMDIHFFVRVCMILYPDRIEEVKEFLLEKAKARNPQLAQDQSYLARGVASFEEQYSLMQEHGIPTVAEDPAFYAEELGVEDLILKGYKLI